jgi:hypothetical protein
MTIPKFTRIPIIITILILITASIVWYMNLSYNPVTNVWQNKKAGIQFIVPKTWEFASRYRSSSDSDFLALFKIKNHEVYSGSVVNLFEYDITPGVDNGLELGLADQRGHYGQDNILQQSTTTVSGFPALLVLSRIEPGTWGHDPSEMIEKRQLSYYIERGNKLLDISYSAGSVDEYNKDYQDFMHTVESMRINK